MAVNYNDCWTYPKEEIDAIVKDLEAKIAAVLPAYEKTDNGKVLKVDGTGDTAVLEWSTDAT